MSVVSDLLRAAIESTVLPRCLRHRRRA